MSCNNTNSTCTSCNHNYSSCNNKCAKCGCKDSFLTSPPPCPTPAGCPDPIPCQEVLSSDCIIYTSPNILCNTDIVVYSDSTLTEILEDLVNYFCNNGGGGGGIGPTGPQGPAGIQGIQGVMGLTGPQGIPGSSSGAGATGATGPQGAQGIPGPVGPAGLNWQGSWSALGVYVPDDAVGFNGASWFCLNAVGPSASNPLIDPANWALLASEGAVGPAGPTGPAGVAGAAGATGPQGPIGLTGSQGIQGITGPTGAQGIQGIQGIPGVNNPSYNVYTAILTRNSIGPISAIVLENTIGPITFMYVGTGVFDANSATGLFILNKTVVFITQEISGVPGNVLYASRITDNTVRIMQSSTVLNNDDWVYPVSIEIRVYN